MIPFAPRFMRPFPGGVLPLDAESFAAMAYLDINPGVHASMLNASASQAIMGEKIDEVVNQASGASNATQTTDSARPFAIPVTDPVFYQPLSSAGTYISVPNEAALKGLGDFTLQVEDVTLPDWTPAVRDAAFISNWESSFGQRGWRFQLDTTGVLQVYISTDGHNTNIYSSTVATGLSDGATASVRVTRNGTDIDFYLDTGAGFVQLGTTVTGISNATNSGNTQKIAIGSSDDGSTAYEFGGTIGAGKVWDNAAQTGDPVLDMRASDLDHLATSGTATSGQTITVIRANDDEAAVLHHSVIRSAEDTMMEGTFDASQSSGRFLAFFYVVNDGGTSGVYFFSGQNSTDGHGGNSSWNITPSVASEDITTALGSSVKTTHTDEYVAGKIVFEALAKTGEWKSAVNNGTPETAVVDVSALDMDEYYMLGQNTAVASAVVYLHRLLFFPSSVSDEDMAEGIALLAAQYDFPITVAPSPPFHYFRPDATSQYLRPDGTSIYIKP